MAGERRKQYGTSAAELFGYVATKGLTFTKQEKDRLGKGRNQNEEQGPIEHLGTGKRKEPGSGLITGPGTDTRVQVRRLE